MKEKVNVRIVRLVSMRTEKVVRHERYGEPCTFALRERHAGSWKLPSRSLHLMRAIHSVVFCWMCVYLCNEWNWQTTTSVPSWMVCPRVSSSPWCLTAATRVASLTACRSRLAPRIRYCSRRSRQRRQRQLRPRRVPGTSTSLTSLGCKGEEEVVACSGRCLALWCRAWTSTTVPTASRSRSSKPVRRSWSPFHRASSTVRWSWTSSCSCCRKPAGRRWTWATSGRACSRCLARTHPPWCRTLLAWSCSTGRSWCRRFSQGSQEQCLGRCPPWLLTLWRGTAEISSSSSRVGSCSRPLPRLRQAQTLLLLLCLQHPPVSKDLKLLLFPRLRM